MEMFCVPMVMMVLRLNTFVKRYKDVHLKSLNFIVKKLYCNKAGKNCNKLCNFNIFFNKNIRDFKILKIYIYIYVYIHTSIHVYSFKKNMTNKNMSMYIYMHVHI